MRPRASSTNAGGIRARSASLSSENRGHCAENEQHAPQAWHTTDASSGDASSGNGSGAIMITDDLRGGRRVDSLATSPAPKRRRRSQSADPGLSRVRLLR
jgi:hypothetical protein